MRPCVRTSAGYQAAQPTAVASAWQPRVQARPAARCRARTTIPLDARGASLGQPPKARQTQANLGKNAEESRPQEHRKQFRVQTSAIADARLFEVFQDAFK